MTSRRREWLARALFEAALILFGLLGAFALNQWQDARQRAHRAEAMMAAIRAELAANLALQAEAATYNTRVVEDIKKIRDAGEDFIPGGVYAGGLLKRPKLTEAAWNAAQNGDVLQELPVDTIIVLGRIYEAQRDYQESTGALFETLYAGAVTGSGAPRRGGMDGAQRLAGVLNDFARRGASLVREYQRVLAYLEGAPPAPPETEPPAAEPPAPETESSAAEPPAAAVEPDSAAAKERP